MKKVLLLALALSLCVFSYGQSLRSIRDSLEVHYGYAAVRSNDKGLWFVVGIPSEMDLKYLGKSELLSLKDGVPEQWIAGTNSKKWLKTGFKIGVCNYAGEEIIAPSYEQITFPNERDTFFILADGRKISLDGSTVPPKKEIDPDSAAALKEYLKDISDTLEVQNGKFVGRRADTLTVYSETGWIMANFIDTTGRQRVEVTDDFLVLISDTKERAFYDFAENEIFSMGEYYDVDLCWFGYRVKSNSGKFGLVSFDGKVLIPCVNYSLKAGAGHLCVMGSGIFDSHYYSYKGKYICDDASASVFDGRFSTYPDKLPFCVSVANSTGTRYALVDCFGDFIIPYTECGHIHFDDKYGSYVMYSESNGIGNHKKYTLGVNRFGRVFGDVEQKNKFGYHVLNGVMGAATGMAVIATAGTALIGGGFSAGAPAAGGVEPASYQDNGSSYYTNSQSSRNSASSAPADEITGSNFQNYENSYDRYADTLSKMYYGQYLYSNSERASIQSEMRRIRETVNSRNTRRKIGQSSWETWNGASKYLK